MGQDGAEISIYGGVCVGGWYIENLPVFTLWMKTGLASEREAETCLRSHSERQGWGSVVESLPDSTALSTVGMGAMAQGGSEHRRC